jgi:hypothetical protein
VDQGYASLHHGNLNLTTIMNGTDSPTEFATMVDAERWRSPAAGSGSDVGASAVSRQVQRVVRCGVPETLALERQCRYAATLSVP